jgi:hypothetical protein
MQENITKSFMFCIKKNGMCAWALACLGNRRGAYRILVGRPEGRSPPEDLGVDGKIILERDLQEIGGGVMNWTDMAQERDGWRAVVNEVTNLQLT